MVRNNTLVIIILLGILSLACSDKKVVYQESFQIPLEGWHKDTVLKGSWTQGTNPSDTKLVLDIDHNSDFGYQNLYLVGQLRMDNQLMWQDTFSIQVAKPKSGIWLGKNVGNDYVVSDTIPYSLQLAPNEQLNYQFSQYSRLKVLSGINKVSVSLIGK